MTCGGKRYTFPQLRLNKDLHSRYSAGSRFHHGAKHSGWAGCWVWWVSPVSSTLPCSANNVIACELDLRGFCWWFLTYDKAVPALTPKAFWLLIPVDNSFHKHTHTISSQGGCCLAQLLSPTAGILKLSVHDPFMPQEFLHNPRHIDIWERYTNQTFSGNKS